LGVEQGLLAVGDRQDDPRSVVAPQQVDAKRVTELADCGQDPFLSGEIRGRELFGGLRAVEIGELRVYRAPPVGLLMVWYRRSRHLPVRCRASGAQSAAAGTTSA